MHMIRVASSPPLPGFFSFLAFFRPSCPCALCPLDSTPPSRVRSSEHRAPQQTLVMTPGTVHGAGLRAPGAPACPLEPSPQQQSSTMSSLTFTARVARARLFISEDAAFTCRRWYLRHSEICTSAPRYLGVKQNIE